MENKELAEQLRIAAEIIETGNDWEVQPLKSGIWVKPYCPITDYLNGPFQIRVKPWSLPAPPEGENWHRASGWKEGMLDKGERPLIEGEVIRAGDIALHGFASVRYGKDSDGDSADARLPIKTSRPLPQKKTKKIVPLGPEDVPPLSVIRHIKGNPNCFRFIQDFSQTGVYILSNYSQNGYFLDSVSFRDLERSYLIKRPTDADFVPAHKEIEE